MAPPRAAAGCRDVSVAFPEHRPRGSCPRTGRRRALSLDPGALRPSDMLVAFFTCAVAMLTAAVVAVVLGELVGFEEWRWLALHLAFVGGVSQLVLGAAQFFVCA